MAFFESYRESNGNFITIPWTFGEWLGAKFIGIILAIIAISLFTIIIPTLWLIIYFFSIEEQRKWIKITAIASAIFFLLDYHFGWLSWRFLTPIIGPSGLDWLAAYNIGILFVFIILLFFDRDLYYINRDNPHYTDRLRKTRLFWYSVGFAIIGYYIGLALLHVGVVTQHIAPVIQNT
jgi:ABC-type transport system involved in multi-copper enzyme maturation permease subunit